MQGVITGARLVAHKEPIVLVGIPESKITDYIAGYTGFNIAEYARSEELDALPDDIVSGATVTIMVIDDSIRRSAIKVARTLGLGGLAQPVVATIKPGSLPTARSSIYIPLSFPFR